MDWHLLFLAMHLIGTVLGVGAATFAEIFIMKSLRDGTIDQVEGSFLNVTYRVIRIGLMLLLISGFGFLINLRLTGMEERLMSPLLWSKLSIVVLILINAVLLQTRKIPLILGSAISFASWYAAMLIIPLRTAIFGAKAGYVEIMLGYGVLVIAGMVILALIKKLLKVS